MYSVISFHIGSPLTAWVVGERGFIAGFDCNESVPC